MNGTLNEHEHELLNRCNALVNECDVILNNWWMQITITN